VSRIHDALTRAQQDRVRSGSTGEAPLSAALPPSPVMTQVAEEFAPANGAVAAGEAFTHELLLARCQQRAWNIPAGKNLAQLDGSAPGLEELRTLRTRLYQLRGTTPMKVLLMASSLPGEGKTFLCGLLAQVIARQRGRRVLLIDGDLRIPRLHDELGAPRVPGLLDYMKGEADEFAIIQRGPVEGMMFVPGGNEATNPSELLAGNRLATLLERVAPCFDWVLIDSPAAVPIADASVLANVCDAVLMVVAVGSTPFDLAQKARNEFRHKPVVGVVLNRVERNAASKYYYAYQSR
jgi:capsular exopolysaccharide synthesis family protein